MHLGDQRAEHLVSRVDRSCPIRARPGETLRSTGVTLPGLPSLVVGSNGHVAWGFTNTGGDWSDLVIVEPDPREPDTLPDADGSAADSSSSTNRSRRRRDAPVPFTCGGPIWGPIVRTRPSTAASSRSAGSRTIRADPGERRHARRNAPTRSRKRSTPPRASASPAQNFVAGDTQWPHRLDDRRADSAPRRIRRLASDVVGGRVAPLGRLSYRAELPACRRSASGRLWTANAPVVEGDMLGAHRRRRLRRRHPRAHHPRSADGDRQSDAGRHALGAARRQRALSRALAGARC